MDNVFTQSIWGDEGFSAILSMKSLPDIIKIIARDTSPPLWNIWEWLVFNTLGTDEIYIRGLSFTFFLLACFFTYKIGRLFFSKQSALISAVLIFLNPFFFTYAFEGRMYSILALGVTASMYFFLKIYKAEEITKWDRYGYIFFTLWALYSHHFSIFAMFIQGLWFLYEAILGRRKRSKAIFKSFILIGLGYLPWLWPLYSQTKKVGGGFWLSTPTTKDYFTLIIDYLSAGIKTDELKIPVINIKLYDSATILVFLVLFLRKWHKNITNTIFLLFWFLLPITLTWLISQQFQSIFFNRYLLYSIPAAMLIVASGRWLASNAVLALLILNFAAIDYHYFTHPTKLPFREMVSYVKENQKEGDFIINWNSASHHIWETKYYGLEAPIYIPQGSEDLPYFVGTALMEPKDVIRQIPEQSLRVGVVTTGSIDEISLPGYTESEAVSFRDIKFIWYEKP